MVKKRVTVDRPVGTLEEITFRLIKACGGYESAAAIARVGVTQLSRYADPRDERDAQMPADVIRALEMHCGKPIMTAYLAAWAGHALVETGRDMAGDDYSEQLANVAAAFNEMLQVMLTDACAGTKHSQARALVAAAAGLQHMVAADMEDQK